MVTNICNYRRVGEQVADSEKMKVCGSSKTALNANDLSGSLPLYLTCRYLCTQERFNILYSPAILRHLLLQYRDI